MSVIEEHSRAEMEASEYDGVHFAQERPAGVVLGLTWDQLAVIGFGVLWLGAGILAQGRMLIVGVVMALVCVLIGILRVQGRSAPGWARLALTHLSRAGSGQLSYKQGMGPGHEVQLVDGEPQASVVDAGMEAIRDGQGRIRPGKPARLRLPGAADELRMYGLPGGAGFVWDPRAKVASVCAKVLTSRGFDLESFDAQESRSQSWGASLAAMGRLPGVVRIQASDQTTVVSGSRVLGYYEAKQESAGVSGADVDPFLDAAFRELMREAQSMPVHEQWVTLVVSPEKIGSQLKALGGGVPALMEHTLKIMATVEGMLPRSGTRVTAWHSPRSLAGLSRAAFDPDSALSVSASDLTGVTVGASANGGGGPMGVEVFPGHLRTDGHMHRVYKVSELPQDIARLGFLDELIFSGEFRHTVSVFMAPVDRGSAMRATKQRMSTWRSDTKMMERLDRPPSPEHEQEKVDIEREQSELMRRHAALDMVVLVSITGRKESELEAAANEVTTAAITAGCELRLLWLEQDAGFMAAALPFGMVKL